MPTSRLVVVAHAADASTEAAAIAAEMRALGFEVDRDRLDPGPRARRILNHRLANARRVILLWSKAAARLPQLRSAASRAKTLGALCVVRIDATPMPAGLGRHAINLKPGRAGAHDWSTLMAASEEAEPRSTTRGHAVLAAALLGLVAAFAAYEADPAFAARIDSWTGVARAQLQHAVDALKS